MCVEHAVGAHPLSSSSLGGTGRSTGERVPAVLSLLNMYPLSTYYVPGTHGLMALRLKVATRSKF